MKSLSIGTNRVYKFLLIIGIFINIFFFFLNFNTAHAQANTSANLQPTDPNTVQSIANQIANSSCPDPIKNLLIDNSGATPKVRNNVTFYLNGTFIVAKDANGQSVGLSCANANALQKLAIRGVMILFTIVGLALAWGAGKSAVGMMTALGDTDKFQENVKGFTNAIVYTVGLIFFYTVLVFVIVGVFGFGRVNNNRPEYNLFCQNRIIFNLAFDQSEPCQ